LGSPQIDRSTSSFNASNSRGCVSIAGFCPPPLRRTLSLHCAAPDRRSGRPRPMCCERSRWRAEPPRFRHGQPRAVHSRRTGAGISSLRNGPRASKRAWMASGLIIPQARSHGTRFAPTSRNRSLPSCRRSDSFVATRLFRLGSLTSMARGGWVSLNVRGRWTPTAAGRSRPTAALGGFLPLRFRVEGRRI
jgi:hypothetical protein